MTNNPFTQKEKELIIEELEDVRDHYDALVEGNVFAEGIEKEEVINRIDTLDNILKKV